MSKLCDYGAVETTVALLLLVGLIVWGFSSDPEPLFVDCLFCGEN